MVEAGGPALRDWIVGQGLRGEGVGGLLEGFVDRLVASGVTPWRVFLGLPTVGPDLRATNHVWRRGSGVLPERVSHATYATEAANSPIIWMLERGLEVHRWRLRGDAPHDPVFPMLEAMRAEGATDYVAHLVGFGGRTATALQGMALTLATDDPAGFREEALALIAEAAPLVGLAAYRMTLLDVAESVLDAYVGPDAGRRVLAGEMRRGYGEAATAALLFADLRGFTAVVEGAATSHERGAAFMERFGRHLAAMVEPVEARGGEVLKFLGDGLLAAFGYDPDEGPGEACARALAAAREALERNEALAADGLLGLDVALHLGTVFYGNIGAGRRLDFTVIGPAVNELARMETLCGTLGEPLLLSAAFARCCGAPTRSLGPHPLRGVAAPRELFAPA
jgi:adenylate cyclase